MWDEHDGGAFQSEQPILIQDLQGWVVTTITMSTLDRIDFLFMVEGDC